MWNAIRSRVNGGERMKKQLLVVGALALLACFITVGLIRGRASRQALNNTPHSLREGAKQNGHKVIFANPINVKRYDDVQSLSRDSSIIVVGSVSEEVSRLRTPEAKSIVTDFKVYIHEVLKGQESTGETITIRGPGGQVQFDDGTSAEVKMPDYWKNPESGKVYTFFLKRKGNAYVLIGGPQGLFETPLEGDVQPQALAEDRLTQNYRGKPTAIFFSEIRRHAGSYITPQ
jgi:hypothetical protein